MWEDSEGPKPRLRVSPLVDGGAECAWGGGKREGKWKLGVGPENGMWEFILLGAQFILDLPQMGCSLLFLSQSQSRLTPSLVEEL